MPPHADQPFWTVGDHVTLLADPTAHGRIIELDDSEGAALVEWRATRERSWQGYRRLKFDHPATGRPLASDSTVK